MHRNRGNDDDPMAELNFIPFIDIALTLVIILMVTTAFIHLPGVRVKLPETATREGSPETKKDLTIVVSSDGAAYVDGVKRSEGQIRTLVMQVAARDKNARVLVKGDRSVLYGRVMSVIDQVRVAGLTHLVLSTDPKPSGEATALATAPVAAR